MRFRLLNVLVGLMIIFLVAACGGGGGSEPAGQSSGAESVTIDVLEKDIYFGETNDNVDNPPVWTVPTGANVTVNVDNQGALQHNWLIMKQGEEIPEPFIQEDNTDLILEDSGILDGGNSDTFDFTAPLPGEYLVICGIAGHYPLMQGRLVVTE